MPNGKLQARPRQGIVHIGHMDRIGLVMSGQGWAQKTQQEQENEEDRADDGGAVAYKAVKDDASLAAPFLH